MVKMVCFMSCDFYHNKKFFFLIITEKRGGVGGLHPSTGRSEAPGGAWGETQRPIKSLHLVDHHVDTLSKAWL